MPRRRRRNTNHADIQRSRGRAELTSHIKHLGLSSEEEYRKWCRDRGIGDGLCKSDRQKRKERQSANAARGDALLTRQRSHTRNRRSTLRQLYDKSLPKGRLGADYLYRVRAGFSRLEANTVARRAYLDLLLAVEPQDRWFGVEPALPHLGTFTENTFVDGLSRLASEREAWVRPLSDWVPGSHNPRRQFTELSRHLLARYDEVPEFLDAAWFGADEVTLRRRQGWLMHLGAGGSLRTAPDVPITLTKRMVHLFLQADPDLTPEEALRWSQVVGQGGDSELATAILRTRLAQTFEHEAFWRSVVTFFVRTPSLGVQHVGPIVDYLQAQKFDPVEHVLPGGEVEVDGPPQPNMTMKSRSVDKLLRQVQQWHDELAQEPVEERSPRGHGKGKRTPRQEWGGSSIGGLDFKERSGHGGERATWSVNELHSRSELATEGRQMHHCVLSLARKCRSGETAIFSLGVRLGAGRRVQVLTIAVDPTSRRITELRGRYNALPTAQATSKGGIDKAYARLMRQGNTALGRWIHQERLTPLGR